LRAEDAAQTGFTGILALRACPEKLLDFFDQDMLQLFDFERVLIDQMIPFDRDAL
jgi:hypothetical protein